MKPKILLYDIETAPNLAYVWGKYEQDVIAYKQEWNMLSFAYKWLGESEIKCVTLQDFSDKTDKHLVTKLHKLFNEADVIVAHNGDEFDQKKAKARFIYHGLKPTRIVPSIDTKKVAKKYFNFNSNSLNDLGEHLGLGTKVKHSGFDLWLGCMNGDQKSWKLMARYNKQDVVLLEKIYNKFLPWMYTHPNMSLIRKQIKGCPKCGSQNTKKDGVRANSQTLQQQHQCKECGGYFLTRLSK